MLSINGYIIEQPLWEGLHRIAFRGRAQPSGEPVVLQLAREERPSLEVVNGFQREIDILSELRLARVPRVRQHGSLRQRPYLILEDRGERSLQSQLSGRPMSVARALRIAANTANVLVELHSHDIMHRDLKPEHLLLADDDTVTLTGFSFATRDAWQVLADGADLYLGRAPAYLSPEQTGRLNRPVDYRTDLYSLGLILYEMLTGRVPFESNDILELIHAHIAREPPPPNTIERNVPRVVCEIVSKLLAKSAEGRYQSASALESDLRRCTIALESEGRVEPFEIAENDVPTKLRIPQRIYGRNAEQQSLVAAFERAANGGSIEFILVRGHAGIGKSSLVNEVRGPVAERRGQFAWGKYEQFDRNVPYRAFVQSFEEVVRQLLTIAPEKLCEFRNSMQQAVGRIGRVVTEVIPAFNLLLGPQPEVPGLTSTEAENRFNLVFLRLLHEICKPEHPLVIFLDDLQWADNASLRLLEVVCSDRTLGHLMLIGAYRDNEVLAGHHLQDVVQRIEKGGTTVQHLAPAPLDAESVLQIITDVVYRPIVEVAPLAELLLAKTGGNPFFVKAFLTHAHEEKVLWFDGHTVRWRWDIGALARMEGTSNVIDLLTYRLRQIDAKVLEIVTLAACIGNRFDLSTLVHVSGVSPERVVESLKVAAEHGQIVQLSNGNIDTSPRYRFAHDRVQQAAYLLVSAKDQPQIHRAIGRALIGSSEARIFDVVNHLNKAIPILDIDSERSELAELNLRAARAAWSAHAFTTTGEFASTGLGLLPSSPWDSKYELTKELVLLAARAASKSGDTKQMLMLSNEIIKSTKLKAEKLEGYDVQIEHYTASSDGMNEAAATGLAALRLVGIDIPTKPTVAHVLAEFAATRLTMRNKSTDQILSLPETTNRDTLAALQVVVQLLGALYTTSPNAFVLVGLKALRLSLTHGNSQYASTCYMTYAVLNAAVFGDIDAGYALASVAQKIANRFEARAQAAAMMIEYIATIEHWKIPLRESALNLRRAADACLEFGQYNGVAHAEGFSHWHLAFTGTPVDQVRDSLMRMIERMQLLRQPNYIAIGRFFHLWASRLTGVPDTRNDGDAILAEFEKGGNNTNLGICLVAELSIQFILGDETKALDAGRRARKLLKFVMGTVLVVQYHFYYALILLNQRNHTLWERQRGLIQGSLSLRKLRQWQRHCEVNCRHKADLIEAEIARLRGDHKTAARLYDQSIENAHAGGFIHEAAVASELAFKHQFALGAQRAARAYLQDARYDYSRWGAVAKVKALERAHPEAFIGARHDYKTALNHEDRVTGASHLFVSTDNAHLPPLDFGSVIKASRVISGEILISNLLSKLMSIALENAGARRGVLFMEREGTLSLEAEGLIDTDDGHPRRHTDSAHQFPEALINYVARTGESVVLDDAAREGPFTFDPYIVKNRVKSVLSAPLLNQGKLIALIYLENNLTVGAFTPNRLEVLTLLLAQAALSIHNASLYASVQKTNERLEEYSHTLEVRVDERTRELREAQKRLVMQEKLASLGSLTSGIAHELKNPLHFIVNFAELSSNSVQELAEAYQAKGSVLDPQFLNDILKDLSSNLNKVNEHALRANSIIQSMLLHARPTKGEWTQVDFNALVDESVRLACNEARSKTPWFKLRIDTEYEANIGLVEIVPQEIGRVLINVVSNACYALRQKQQLEMHSFVPVLFVRTRALGQYVEVRVHDNGPGIHQTILTRVYEPFFTTKPAGEGTGLGLSISHDIVVNGHRGEIKIDTSPGEFTEVVIILPKKATLSSITHQ